MKRNRLFSLVSAWVGLAVCTGASLAADPAPVLVKDIREGELPKGIDIHSKVVAGGKLFMSATAEGIPGDLWISDGTAAGTLPVKEIYGNLMDPQIRGMTAAASRVFFVADDSQQSGRLWVSDGTQAGTFKVPGIGSPEAGSPDYVVPGTLRALGTSVIFVAWIDGEASLWKSDGTATGSVKLKTLNVDVSTLETVSWTVAGSNLYFSLPKEDFTVELWKTNGTSGGTTLVKNLGSTFSLSDPQMLGAVGSTLYFAWESADHGIELWKSSGTSAGTVMVKDIAEGTDSSSPRKMVVVGTKGYFLATTAEHGEELWVTDGTAAGTTLLHEVTPGETSSEFTLLAPLGKYVIAAYQQGAFEEDETTYYSRGVMAWDTAANAPARLFDDQFYDRNFGITDLVSAGTQAFFLATDNYNKTYLYHTNGTPSGTGYFTDPQMKVIEGSLAAGNGTVFFNGDHEVTGNELWKSDGTEAGTVMVKNTVATGRSSDIQRLVTRAGQVYFTADDGIHGRELWTSDGTAGGTHLVKDIAPGSADSLPQGMAEMNGLVYFFAEDGTVGSNLWRTDGTEAGTVKIEDAAASGFFGGSGVIGVLPQVGGGRLFFSGYHMAQGRELWVSDGVSSFTVLTETLTPGITSSNPDQITLMDGRVYFIAGSARGLYSTDGGAPVREASAYGSIRSLVVRPPTPGAAVLPEQSLLFFTAPKSGATALYRWSAGAEPLELMSGSYWVGVNGQQIRGEHFIFIGPGPAVWRTDGTVAGTQSLGGSLVTVTEDKIYYLPTPSSTELWSRNLDGSSPVRCLSGFDSFQIGAAYPVGKTLFFSTGPTDGGRRTFWRTQGTAETTRQIPNISSVNPSHEAMTLLGDRLYLVGFQEEPGEELFALDIGGRLEVDLLTDTTPTALAPGATVDLGMDAGAGGLTRTLRLRNTGTLPLTAVTVTQSGLADYTVTPTSIGTLAAGATADVQISFTALQPGVRDSSLSITAQRAASQTTFGLVLKGRGLGTGDKPVIGTLPAARLALAGQPLVYDIPVGSIETPTFIWRRGTATVGTSPALSLAASAADAGVYAVTVTNGAGSVTSNESALGIITPAPVRTNVVEGAALTLTCTAKAPTGATLSYLWRFNGAAITPTLVPGSSDATKPMLKITGMTEPKAGNYDCLVTLTTPAGSVSLSAGVTDVDVLLKPVILPPAQPLVAYIGQDFSYTVQTSLPATRFTVKGLPAGLKLSPAGIISGRPTKSQPVNAETGLPAPYIVTLTAGNSLGMGAPGTLSLQVLPLLPQGSYDGLINREAALDEGMGLGSRVTLQITTTGALSGQLVHGAKTYRFTSAVFLPQDHDAGFPDDRVRITISRGKTLAPLMLTLALNADSATMILANDQEDQAEGLLRKVAFGSKAPAPVAYQGYYTHQVGNDGDIEYAGQEHLFPRGQGYLMSKISSTGIVTWKGKLADGSVITGSSALCQDETGEDQHHLVIRQDLYKGLGSVQGWGQVAPLSETAAQFGAEMDWNKAALPATSKERNYKDGFPLHGLTTWGGKYVAPDFKNGELLLNIPTDANAASLELYYASLPEGGLTQSFTLGPKAKVTLPKWDGAEIFAKSLSFNVAQGSFKGSFSLKDPNPDAPNKPFIRTVNFEGVILGYPTNAAIGFFLLPDLPADGTTLTTSPLQSGSVSVY